MKEAENNEIALLLRNLGKRGSGATGVGAQAESTTTHLDPDELSSFAEGVLPPATRALYAGHLADCDRCRSIVATLALASGTAVQTKTEKVAGFNLWHYLGTIFSPKVMRVAVPVMSAVIIAAIAFVWLRSEKRATSVAQLSEQERAAAPAGTTGNIQQFADEERHEAAPGRASAAKNIQPEARAVESPATTAPAKVDQQKGADADASANKEQPKEQPASQPTTVAETETKSRVAGAAPPPAANEAVRKPQSRERDDLAKKTPEPGSADRVTNYEAKPEANKREEKAKDAADEKARAARSSPFGGFGVGGRMLRRAETRSVGGRRFSREDNRWVDTEYKPSSSVTNVTRNSEQYRALIGDEPGLRTIAEELDGEVIVVWKGNAYRIR